MCVFVVLEEFYGVFLCVCYVECVVVGCYLCGFFEHVVSEAVVMFEDAVEVPGRSV